MMEIKKMIGHLLYEVDFFKSPFYFTFNSGRSKMSTKLGSFFSLLIIGVMLYFFLSSQMILKTNPSITSQIVAREVRPDITLINQDFQMTVGVYDRSLVGYEIDESMFSINLNQYNVTSDSNGIPRIEVKTNKIYICTSLIYYCAEDFNFTLKGYLNEAFSQFISINIMICDNDTMNNTCKRKEEIDTFLNGKYLGVTYHDFPIDFNNYEDPLKDTQQFEYFAIDTKNSKKMSIFMKKNEFFDDDNLIVYDSKLKIETYTKDFVLSDFSQSLIEDKATPLAEILIFSSQNIQEIKRNYQKFGQILATMSGIYNFLIIFCYMVMKILLEMKKKKHIMKYLYDFDNYSLIYENSDKKNQKINFFENLYRKFIKKFIFKEGENNEVKLEFEKSKSSIKMQDENPQKKEKRFTNFFKKLTKYPLLSFNEKYNEEYDNIINLRSILKNLQDLQKLKIILFDQTQLKLFHQLPKPKLLFNKKILNYSNVNDPAVHLFDILNSKRLTEKNIKITPSLLKIKDNYPNSIDERLKYFNSQWQTKRITNFT